MIPLTFLFSERQTLELIRLIDEEQKRRPLMDELALTCKQLLAGLERGPMGAGASLA